MVQASLCGASFFGTQQNAVKGMPPILIHYRNQAFVLSFCFDKCRCVCLHKQTHWAKGIEVRAPLMPSLFNMPTIRIRRSSATYLNQSDHHLGPHSPTVQDPKPACSVLNSDLSQYHSRHSAVSGVLRAGTSRFPG